MELSDTAALQLVVRGHVQGVGFRPFVLRLARQCRLGGRVYNDPVGVCIEVEGREEDVAAFRRRLVSNVPPAAHLDAVSVSELLPTGRDSFVIDPSSPAGTPLVRVPRDLALCADCRRDVEEAGNRRHSYPFTN